jgi:anti-sigma factor RsiW
MPPNVCEQYPDRLVDYADGDLSAADARQVAEHLGACPACRRRLMALRQSLAATQGFWQARADQLADIGTTAKPRMRRVWPRAAVGVAAAVLLLVLARFAVWQRHEPVAAPAEVVRQVEDAGLAEQMLVVGRMLSETPGGQPYAAERFRYITEHYPATGAAHEARTCLAAMTEKG